MTATNQIVVQNYDPIYRLPPPYKCPESCLLEVYLIFSPLVVQIFVEPRSHLYTNAK